MPRSGLRVGLLRPFMYLGLRCKRVDNFLGDDGNPVWVMVFRQIPAGLLASAETPERIALCFRGRVQPRPFARHSVPALDAATMSSSFSSYSGLPMRTDTLNYAQDSL